MKGFFYVGFSFGVKMLCALVVLRALAGGLGGEGFGYITQYMAFLAIVFGLSLGGASNYLINKLSQSDSIVVSEKEVSIVFSYGFLCLMLLAIVMFGFKGLLETYIFFRPLQWWFTPYCLILFFVSNIYGCLVALALAKKKLKLFAFSNIVGSLIYLALVLCALELKQIEYIYWVMPLSYVLPALFMLRAFPERIRVDFKSLFQESKISVVFRYCLIVYAGLVSLPFIGILVRNQFLQHFGVVELSNWQVAVKFSDTMQQFYGLFCTSILLPYFSKHLPNLKFLEWQKKLLLLSVGYVGVAVAVFFMRDLIVSLLFGSGYESARQYFSYYLLGDYFRGVALFCSFTLISVGRYGPALFFEVAQGALFLFAYHLLQAGGKVESVGYSYVISYVLCALIMCVFVILYFRGREVENTPAM